jgi:predicted nucleotidyltransferase
MNLIKAFNKIFAALNKNKVEYILIGGYAVVLHGLPRTTQDIDIFVNATEENIVKLRSALMETFNDKSIEEITLQELNKYPVIRYGTPEGFNIDIITRLGEEFKFKDLKYDTTKMENVKINFADIDTLIKLKEKTFREIDNSDILFLKAKKDNAGL